jgi:uncharacterized protein
MPVIDFHVHTAFYQSLTPSYQAFLQRQWGDQYAEMIRKYSSPAEFLGLMDEGGIDYAVILAELAPITTGIVDNEYISHFCSHSPRLIPFASINPGMCTRPDEELQDLLLNRCFRGLKLYPTYQHFYPNDPLLYPLYAKAQELKIPVMFHLGSSVFANSRLKYGDPLYIDDVACDFPDLVLIQCHSGRPLWYDTAFTMARLHPNVYMEISGLPPQKLLRYFPEMERLVDKVIYGSDWPGVPTIRENIRMINALPLSEDSKRKILGNNAARILGLAA